MATLTAPPRPTSTAASSPAAPPAADQPGMTRREELAFVVFSSWMTLGLFLDGWSHNQRKPETFFTPWHGLLYSGFAAAVLWGVIDSRRQKAAGAGTSPVERLTMLGAVCFGVGAMGDFLWHTIFGIEVGIEGLLSPTHLLLMTGGLLAATAPIRARWNDDMPPRLSAFIGPLVSMTVATGLVSFFMQFATAFHLDARTMALGDTVTDAGQLPLIYGIVSILITNLILLVPAVIMVTRWRPPYGSLTIFFTVVALAVSGLRTFDHLPLVLPAVLAGVAGDLLVRRWHSVMTIAAVIPAVLWTSYFIVYAAAYKLAWPAELPAGTVFFAILSGLAVAKVATVSVRH